MKRILVTGGAGFIGSHLVEALLERGHKVRVLDNFSTGKRNNLRSVRNDIEILAGDCADLKTAVKAMKGIEVVYHEAAVPSVALSVAEPFGSHHANATATMAMLVAARDAGVERFMYAGSSSVYGDSKEKFKKETHRAHPLSPYGAAKFAGETYVRIFAELYGMQTLTMRYFNVFGPRQDPSSAYSGVISRFSKALLKRETPVIYGDGKQSRDFTFIANVVHANLLALDAPGLKGQTVNIATSKAHTLNQLLATLIQLSGREAQARYEPTRTGDIRHSLADTSAARKLLKYRPQVDFESGLARTFDWYSSAGF
ncbi:MAG: SDR family oxidoreductase [Vicinamibacteria bacterium]|jgi:nucleoside-diphosphate-sugar epimerase|nr:SDR family oxidoreductase [Vicinamibacteria bacterium]